MIRLIYVRFYIVLQRFLTHGKNALFAQKI